MIPPFSFTVTKVRLARRLSSDLQHKLRVMLKCYTIFNFILKEDQTFEFRKRHRHFSSKLVFTDPKQYQGSYRVDDIDEEFSVVTIENIQSVTQNEQEKGIHNQ